MLGNSLLGPDVQILPSSANVYHGCSCAWRVPLTGGQRLPQAHSRHHLRQNRRQTLAHQQTPRNRGHAALCRAQAVNVAVAEPAASQSCFEELSTAKGRRYVMVSGKGGVGKTSLSASLAVKFAAAGHSTLVVSTDPAHSLGDSLAQDLSGGMPVPIEGTELPLWAMEIDTEKATSDFRASSAAGKGKGGIGFLKGTPLEGLGGSLGDLKLGELLETAPPGLDEAVAIAKVVEFVQGEKYERFTRIVLDTAPTGHTLRLLKTPEVIDASLGKLIQLRQSLSKANTAVRGLFGASEQQDEAVEKLQNLQNSVRGVRDLFHNADLMELVIATIPTVLGMNESARLASQLQREGVPCKRIVVNQVIGEGMGDAFLRLRLKDQQKAMDMITQDEQLKGLQLVRAPLVDLEVRGIPALDYFGGVVWQDTIQNFAEGQERKYVMLGGKGGVGKTSMSASLAVRLAGEGHSVLVVSTDPAHSLSDSLNEDVSGGRPKRLSSTDLPIWGMEIDPEAARDEMRAARASSGNTGDSQLKGVLGPLGMGGLADQIGDLKLGELLDNLPPGADEAIAIAKIVEFAKSPEYSHFTRIVIDTAPTGHTLRLLTLPDFFNSSIGKVIQLQQRLSQIGGKVKDFFSGGKKKAPENDRMSNLQDTMAEMRSLFRNPATTQFVVVTIPTVMAASESTRLAASLRKEGVPVRLLVVNQIIQESATQQFLAQRRKDQQKAMQQLKEVPIFRDLQVMEAPLFDLEIRGVPALQYFGEQVWR
ncbi:hypothetical protein WJX84_008222 [Apatococcus fuscideae]|uniref:ArsA/GET3 Anion-transporting ATPase-like domain-containing protein n=1 Tax=Apatococcus fuscideae TaxID=2026836 RepID=A0AAW1SRB6_9CHLO